MKQAIRTITTLNLHNEEVTVPLIGGFFTEDYIERRGDVLGIEQEAKSAAGDDFVCFGWQQASEDE